MKKVFRFVAIAVVACGLCVACNNNKTEQVEDSVIEEMVEDTIDSVEMVAEEVAEDMVAEEPVKKA